MTQRNHFFDGVEDNDQPGLPPSRMLTEAEWQEALANGITETELLERQPFGPIFHRYTRQDAIDGGVLVDLMQPATVRLVRDAGILVPVAMTATAFAATIAPISGDDCDNDDFEFPVGQSLNRRLWDVLTAFWCAARGAKANKEDTDRVFFNVRVNRGHGDRETVQLYAVIGPGDTADPVLTIMLIGED
jgi:hypothetical protein